MRQTGGAIELRRPRKLDEIVLDSWALLKPRLSVLAAVVTPSVLVVIAIALVGEAISSSVYVQLLVRALFLPVQVLTYQLVSSAVVILLKANEQGRMITAGEALDAALERARDILSVSIKMMFVFVLLVTIVGAYWGLKKAVQWIVTVPALILDDLPANEAFLLSERLIEGRWWATLGRLIAGGFVLILPASVLSLLFVAAVPAPIGTILAYLPNLISTPFLIIATVLLFFDLKARAGRAL